MKIECFPISGPMLLTPPRIIDSRGFFSETFNARAYANAGIAAVFVQDNHSLSAERGVVRGLHYQKPPHAQAKLVRVAKGAILDIAVDIRKGSSTYGQHIAVTLSDRNWSQLFVPIGFAHGFCTLEPDTEVQYKVTDYYAPEVDAGILWNDPGLCIAWPDFAGRQVSHKDAVLPRLADIVSPFTI